MIKNIHNIISTEKTVDQIRLVLLCSLQLKIVPSNEFFRSPKTGTAN